MSLTGLRIVITRQERQSGALIERIEQEAAIPILLPCIEILPPSDPEPLRTALAALESYDWLVFTSQSAVQALELDSCPATKNWSGRVAAVGSSTKRAAEAAGLRVNLQPETYTAEALADAFDGVNLRGKRILIPSSAITRDVVAPALRAKGAEVDVIEAYRNEAPAGLQQRAATIFRQPYPDWVLFASPSAVQNLEKAVGADQLNNCKLASIGPATTEALQTLGCKVRVEANPHTTDGLMASIENCPL